MLWCYWQETCRKGCILYDVCILYRRLAVGAKPRTGHLTTCVCIYPCCVSPSKMASGEWLDMPFDPIGPSFWRHRYCLNVYFRVWATCCPDHRPACWRPVILLNLDPIGYSIQRQTTWLVVNRVPNHTELFLFWGIKFWYACSYKVLLILYGYMGLVFIEVI